MNFFLLFLYFSSALALIEPFSKYDVYLNQGNTNGHGNHNGCGNGNGWQNGCPRYLEIFDDYAENIPSMFQSALKYATYLEYYGYNLNDLWSQVLEPNDLWKGYFGNDDNMIHIVEKTTEKFNIPLRDYFWAQLAYELQWIVFDPVTGYLSQAPKDSGIPIIENAIEMLQGACSVGAGMDNNNVMYFAHSGEWFPNTIYEGFEFYKNSSIWVEERYKDHSIVNMITWPGTTQVNEVWTDEYYMVLNTRVNNFQGMVLLPQIMEKVLSGEYVGTMVLLHMIGQQCATFDCALRMGASMPITAPVYYTLIGKDKAAIINRDFGGADYVETFESDAEYTWSTRGFYQPNSDRLFWSPLNIDARAYYVNQFLQQYYSILGEYSSQVFEALSRFYPFVRPNYTMHLTTGSIEGGITAYKASCQLDPSGMACVF